MKTKTTLALALNVLLALSGCSSPTAGFSDQAGGGPPAVGGLAPNFTLAEYQGEALELREVVARSKLVLINFWATWCGPCLIEMPLLESLYNKYQDKGFSILAVNLDYERSYMEEYLGENPLSFSVLYDSDQRVQNRYNVYALPTSILVNQEGQVLSIIRGYSPYLEGELEAILQSL